MADAPSIITGSQTDYKKLYYSDPDAALKITVTISPGFGVLKQGTCIAKNTSTGGRAGYYIPYEPALKTGAEEAPGRIWLLVDGADSTTAIISNTDSYKLYTGDDLSVVDSDTSIATTPGNLVTISRSDTTGRCTLTTAGNVASTFTVGNYAHLVINGSTSAVGILEKSVDTGTGVNAKGALATLIVSNAVLYYGMLLNCDSTAYGSSYLNGTLYGQYLVIK